MCYLADIPGGVRISVRVARKRTVPPIEERGWGSRHEQRPIKMEDMRNTTSIGRIGLIAVLAFVLQSACSDRLFDNPFDPDFGEALIEVVNTISTPAPWPRGLAWDGTTLWNVDASSNTLYSLNRLNGSIVRALSSPLPGTSGIAYDGRDLWVCGIETPFVFKISVLNGDIQRRLNLQKGAFTAVAFGREALWLADHLSNRILEVDPETAEVLSSFPNPGPRANGLAFDGSSLWIADSSTLSITRVSLTGQVLNRYLTPGQSPQGLAHDGVFLWNADGGRKIFQMKIGN